MTHEHAVALLDDLAVGGCEAANAICVTFNSRDDAERRARFAAWLREWADALEEKT
jgi:hypothetical protein